MVLVVATQTKYYQANAKTTTNYLSAADWSKVMLELLAEDLFTALGAMLKYASVDWNDSYTKLRGSERNRATKRASKLLGKPLEPIWDSVSD